MFRKGTIVSEMKEWVQIVKGIIFLNVDTYQATYRLDRVCITARQLGKVVKASYLCIFQTCVCALCIPFAAQYVYVPGVIELL